jgi:hypothetical protein
MATSNCNNCGCKKCGCQDDFLTTPPACPTPIGCPTPEPCSEIIDAQCIVYTGLDIECDDDIVVETDTTLADALVDIVTYFCDNGGGGGTGPAGPAGATGPQGAQGVPGPVGPAGLNWQGSWSSLGVYAPDDAVGFAGASWFCLNAVGPSVSNPTIDPTNWALLASEGAVGPQGPIGPAGSAGAQGPTGIPGTGSTNIGKLLGGGIVVAEWDQAGVHKGLIASLTTIAIGVQWTVLAEQTTLIGPTAQSFSDGFTNTNAIIAQTGFPAANTYAAGLARLHNGGGYTDWYLPSLQELNMCYNSITVIDKVLGSNNFPAANYWSSTENAPTDVYSYMSNIGVATTSSKSAPYAVRAVRIHNI